MLALRRARRCVTAWVRRAPYERDGVVVRGAWHFGPAAKVYVEPPFSGDGWERAYMVGRHRETARWTRIVGPRARLRGFHVEEVTDPVALDLLRDCAAWEDDPRNREWMEQIDAASRAPREAPWSDDAWREAVERAWTPERPSLAANAARVMRCDERDAAAWARDATLGARLHAVETGRWAPPDGDPERSAGAAWEMLAPPAWIDDPARRLLTVRHHDEEVAPTARPTTLPAAVSFASDVAGVTAAEELARELARALGLPPVREVAWRIGTLAAMQGHLEMLRGSTETGAVARALRLGRALLRDDDELAASIAREDVTPPWRGLFELVSRGYALAALGDGRAELVATDLSRARWAPPLA